MDSGELIHNLFNKSFFQINWNIKYSDLLPLNWYDLPLDQNRWWLYKHEIWSLNLFGPPDHTLLWYGNGQQWEHLKRNCCNYSLDFTKNFTKYCSIQMTTRRNFYCNTHKSIKRNLSLSLLKRNLPFVVVVCFWLCVRCDLV